MPCRSDAAINDDSENAGTGEVHTGADYRADAAGQGRVPQLNVPRFAADYDMATAILRHVEEAWRLLAIEVKRWETTDPLLAWDVMIRTGPNGGYAGSGPTRGIAVCRAALFLAANRARKWERPE